jgi:hypothetical protein
MPESVPPDKVPCFGALACDAVRESDTAPPPCPYLAEPRAQPLNVPLRLYVEVELNSAEPRGTLVEVGVNSARRTPYLETDKTENVRFYERFGFEVIGEEPVIGVPNWFMRRGPRSEPGS